MIYRFIAQHRSTFGVQTMCQVLGVSRSGYYAWRTRPESARAQATRQLSRLIHTIYQEARGVYGSPRITQVLQDRGYHVSRPRVARLMRHQGLAAKTHRAFRRTTICDTTLPVAPNRLQQHFTVARPNRVWVSDITYIKLQTGWQYLTVVLDLCHRKVVGWACSAGMTAEETTVAALRQAWEREQPSPELLFHSDRGGQYAAHTFRELLAHYQMVQSMSGTGNCYDNAVAESFFKTLKTELIYHERYQTAHEVRQSMFEYIEVFYNRLRKHSTLGYLSPEQYIQTLTKNAA
jgi:transposase InsO family protein